MTPATKMVARPSTNVTTGGTDGCAAGAGVGFGGAAFAGAGGAAGAGAVPAAASLIRRNGTPIVLIFSRALWMLAGGRSMKPDTGPESATPPTTRSPSRLKTTTDAPRTEGTP